jgi:hypothetical protein
MNSLDPLLGIEYIKDNGGRKMKIEGIVKRVKPIVPICVSIVVLISAVTVLLCFKSIFFLLLTLCLVIPLGILCANVDHLTEYADYEKIKASRIYIIKEKELFYLAKKCGDTYIRECKAYSSVEEAQDALNKKKEELFQVIGYVDLKRRV